MSAIPSEALTMRDAGEIVVRDGRRVGCIIHLRNGLWAAWSGAGKIGEYPTPGEAANAAYKAVKPKRGARI